MKGVVVIELSINIGNNDTPIIDCVIRPMEPILDEILGGKNNVIYILLPQCGQTDVPRCTVLLHTGHFLLAITDIAAIPNMPSTIPTIASSSLPIFAVFIARIIKMTYMLSKYTVNSSRSVTLSFRIVYNTILHLCDSSDACRHTIILK